MLDHSWIGILAASWDAHKVRYDVCHGHCFELPCTAAHPAHTAAPWTSHPAWVAPTFGRWGEAIKFEIGPAECRCGGAVRGRADEPLAITHRQSAVVSGLKSWRTCGR